MSLTTPPTHVSHPTRTRSFSVLLLAAAAFMAPGAPRAADDQGFQTDPVSVADTNIAPGGLPQLVAVEVGHHDSFDRVVFRFSSHVPGYNVSYVPEVRHD